jgi:hypothetical protein
VGIVFCEVTHRNSRRFKLMWNIVLTIFHQTENHPPSFLAGLEPAILASDRPQNHALDRAATKSLYPTYSGIQTGVRVPPGVREDILGGT